MSVSPKDSSHHEPRVTQKIGFIEDQPGVMGKHIVKNLLKTGQRVTVWSRTPNMNNILEDRVVIAKTPADVVRASDIIFSFVSDSDGVKKILFQHEGVLEGFTSCSRSNKGYIEMTFADPETSNAVAFEIRSKGGRYLEAPTFGGEKEANEGSLFFLAAGDPFLFRECGTCFRAMGDGGFIGEEVGKASKMAALQRILHGTFHAALMESMSLVKKCKLSQADLLKLLESESFNCQALQDGGLAILKNDFAASKQIQEGLNWALMLSELVDQPLPIAASAKELLKNPKKLFDMDRDVSDV